MVVNHNMGKKSLLLEAAIYEELTENYLTNHYLLVEVLLNILVVLGFWRTLCETNIA